MRKFSVTLMLFFSLFAIGCNSSLDNEKEILYEENEVWVSEKVETSDDTEEVKDAEITDWEEYYRTILENYTSEIVYQVITGDFKGDGMTQAFIITTPQPLEVDDTSEVYKLFATTSLWYLDGETCQNVYLDSDKYSVICEYGYIQEKMIIAIGTLTAWDPERNYDSTIWYVSEGEPVSVGTMARVESIEDGYLITSYLIYGEDEDGEYRALIYNDRYSFDNGTINLVDSHIAN